MMRLMLSGRRQLLVLGIVLPVAIIALTIPLRCCCGPNHDLGGHSTADCHSSCALILPGVCAGPHCGPCPQRFISLNNSDTKQGLSHGTFTRVPALLAAGTSFAASSSLPVLASYSILKFNPTVDSLHTIVLLI